MNTRNAMPTRSLGTQGLRTSAEGLGCMGMSEFYGPANDAESIATIHRALDLGVSLLDTSDMYGPYTNERLVGSAIQGRRDQVVLATRFGIVRDPSDPTRRGVNGRPEYVRTLEENVAALHVQLTADDLRRIDEAAPKGAAAGERYAAAGMKTVGR